jgi:Zn-dependent membrane protease YugP
MGYWLFFFIIPLVFGLVVQSWLKSTFNRNANIRVASGLSGAEVARRILDSNGLSGVQVRPTKAGPLSDHYDPRSRTVNLSQPVYQGRSIAATAVAAHEVGHAIQHAKAYAPMQARTAIWPVASLASQAWMFFLIGGFIFQTAAGYNTTFLWVAVGLYVFAVLFQIVTLPVEFNASSRARAQVAALGLADGPEQAGVKATLRAAAMTYVAGALAALLQLLWLFAMASGSRS